MLLSGVGKLTKRKNMKHHNKKQFINRLRILASAGLVLVATIAPLFMPDPANAAGIAARKLELLADTDEGSTPGGVVAHRFTFEMPAGGSFQSLVFEYCTTPADGPSESCIMPTGLDTTNASLDAESTGTLGSTTLTNTTNGSPYVFWGAAQNPGAAQTVSFTLGNITNPTNPNETFYVRMAINANNDGTGATIHSGTVAASTALELNLNAVMPESLIFCVGAYVDVVGNVPDCTSATSADVYFNNLLSSTNTRFTYSQMAATTNASSGYQISVNGTTLTNGGNTIAGMATAGTPVTGTAQFGLNIATTAANGFGAFDNDQDAAAVTPDIDPDTDGAIFPASIGSGVTTRRAEPTSDYRTAGTFKFLPGETEIIADSGYDDTGAGYDQSQGPSDSQRYTVTYIANVPGSQAPGDYATTLLYICTPSF